MEKYNKYINNPEYQFVPYSKQSYGDGGFVEFNNGGTHEENPHGGIPLGQNALVEEGETRHQNYIYSDRIKLPWNKKRTFAEESKRINNKYKDRPDDAIANKSKELELSKLKDAQELMKQQMVQKANTMMKDAGMHQMPDGSMMANNQMGIGGTLMKPLGEAVGDLSPEKQQQFGNVVNGIMNVAKFIPGVGQITSPIQNMINSQLPQNNLQMAYGGKIKYDGGGTFTISNEDPYGYTPQTFDDLTANQNIPFANELSAADLKYMQMLKNGQAGNTNRDLITDANNPTDIDINYSVFPEQIPIFDNLTPNNNLNEFGTRMGQASVGSNSATGSNTNNTFNDELTTAEKLIPFAPVLGQAATLIGGAEKTKYQRADANLIDLEEQRRQAKKQAAVARLTAGQNIRNTAGNTGRGLTNTVTSNAAIYDSLSNQLGQSYMNEQNANAGILNQTNQFNTQIANAENDANAMNRAKFRDTAVMTLANLAGTYTGINKDQKAYRSQNLYNTTAAGAIGTEDYGAVLGYTKDGMPIYDMKYKTK